MGDHPKKSTPNIPASAATFTVSATTRISAPASLVFRTLRNTETWRDWNRFCPRVSITTQPDESNDDVTAAEIAQLVRNTSVAGSVDSDITDGAAPGTHGLIGRRLSTTEESNIRLSPPPVTRERLRSHASGMSGDSRRASVANSTASGTPKHSGIGERPKSMAAASDTNGSGVNSLQHLSAAQRYGMAQEIRKQSIATGQAPPAAANNILVEAPHDPNQLIAAPPTSTSNSASQTQRRGSATAYEKRLKSIHALYGEPSVRIQLGTEMTMHVRMRMPTSMAPDREINIVVTEVSRPDDPSDFAISPAQLAAHPEAMQAALARTQTHTVATSNVYRIVWSMRQEYTPPKAYPKFLLQTERVIEIRSSVRGDGKEECVMEDWESQRGVMAGKVKKRSEGYLEQRWKEWGRGLAGYCESMGGDVERRDFVS